MRAAICENNIARFTQRRLGVQIGFRHTCDFYAPLQGYILHVVGEDPHCSIFEVFPGVSRQFECGQEPNSRDRILRIEEVCFHLRL